MRHFDVYCVKNAETGDVLGHVAVAVEPDTTNCFAYYFRDTEGVYTFLISITSMDVSAVLDLEKGKLWDLVDNVLVRTGVARTYTHLNDLEWGKASKIAPNVTAGSWLSNMVYYFVED